MTDLMRVVSLCTEIDAIDLSCEMTGLMEIVGQVELDPFCRTVLEYHWPQAKRLLDIRQAAGNEFGTVDLVIAGFPLSAHKHRR